MEVAARLLAASREQRVLDLGGATVAAADIRAACLAAAEADPFGLRLAHARIEGMLDLRAFELAVPLEFASCDFTGPVDVSGARLHELVIVDDRPAGHPPSRDRVLSGLIANGVRIAHDLDLSGMVITGSRATSEWLVRSAAVWLAEAEIGGRFLAHGTRIEVATGRAMHCDRTAIAGEVHLSQGFRATGELRWVAVDLSGSLDLSGAQLLPHDGRALDLAGARVGGSIFLLEAAPGGGRCRVHGRVELRHASVEGQIFARNADLAASPTGAGGHLYNTAESIEGQVDLDNSRIHGPIRVAGDVRLAGLDVLGGFLDFRGASIAGVFNADGAFLSNPGDKTVNLHMAHIRGIVRLTGGFHSVGLVVLSRVTVDSRLRCDGAVLVWRDSIESLDPPAEDNPDGFACAAVAAQFRGGVALGWTVTGGVDFGDALTSTLADRPSLDWPAHSELGGFRYDRFASPQGGDQVAWDAGTRIAWLSRLRTYDPRAWEQLALVLRTAGDRDGSEAVLVAQRRHARRMGLARWRLFDVLQDVTLRYGRDTWYPTGDALLVVWLNLCTILGWVASTVFAISFTRLGRSS